MLPGAYSVPRDFIDQGFVSSLHAQGFAVDVALADAHLGYAENGTLLERLRDDVIVPAQRDGYRRIWLVGISLGGFASLGLLMRQPESIEGVLAIAPVRGLAGIAASRSLQRVAPRPMPKRRIPAMTSRRTCGSGSATRARRCATRSTSTPAARTA